MTGGQKFCLRWDGFRSRLSSVFDELRQDGELLDVTLCCDGGHTVKAHRILLSASSPCLRQLLKDHPCQHPVFFLKDTSAEDLRAIIEFVYNGEVNVSQTQLASFIKTAELLQIRGLSGDGDPEGGQPVPSARPQDRPTAASSPPPPPRPPPPDTGPSGDGPAAGQPPAKRRRHSGGPSGAPGPANTAAANASTIAKAASASSAAGTSVAEAGSTGNPQPIKAEQVELSDDESAALEDTLACLSTFEAQSCSPQPVLDSSGGPQPREARRGDPSGDQSAGPSAGPSTSGAASQQGTRPRRKIIKPRDQYFDDGTLFAVLDHDLVLEDTIAQSLSTGQELVSSDELDNFGKQPDLRSLPPLTIAEVSEPQLDVRILSKRLLRKLNRRQLLTKADLWELAKSIHRRYAAFDYHIRNVHRWYLDMAESIVERFPSIIPNVRRKAAVRLLATRVNTKFKNERKPSVRARRLRKSPFSLSEEFIGPDQNDNPVGQSTDADLMDTSNSGGNALVGENSDSDAS